MNLVYAIILGAIQGVTEFLPISSTAHLTLAGEAFHLVDPAHPELWTQFMAVIQLGTMAAVIVYFWSDLLAMISSFFRDAASGALLRGVETWAPATRLAVLVIVGTVPVAIIGLTLKHAIEGTFTKSLTVIACSLIALALLLWLAEKTARHLRDLTRLTWIDALAVGLAQAFALIPGSSRSGTTITAGLFLGLKRADAARFSFLLSIPAVLASGLFELYESFKLPGGVHALGIGNLAVGIVVSGVTGYAAIAWLLRYLMKNTTMVFIWYRLALGLLILALLIAGVVSGPLA
ncbi:MAG TPA: undecaprenyl-diphosphatase UppP [Bacteroidota bacterium]